jgi:hypothetical protein
MKFRDFLTEATGKNDLVLVGEWYVKDNWYGKSYRVILMDTGFKKKTEFNQYKSLLTKYVKKKYNQKLTASHISVGKLDAFPEYTYVANGPSRDITHYEITTDVLDEMRPTEKDIEDKAARKADLEMRKSMAARRKAHGGKRRRGPRSRGSK